MIGWDIQTKDEVDPVYDLKSLEQIHLEKLGLASKSWLM